MNLFKKLFCSSEQQQIDELEQQVAELEPEEWPELETTKVGADFIEDSLSELDGWDEIYIHRPMDRKYRVPNREDFVEAAKRESTNLKEYRKDYFDCEDFTRSFAAAFPRKYRCNGVGVVLTYDGSPHAFNVVVFEDGTAELWEPQSDSYRTDNNDEMYSLDGAVVHF